ncbi:MAG: hypothetical protein H6751_02455 [Candidatus Omnitrophica bacterium]|nr:hypothetical protein [Candidatus Omnitrophota bacterium]
MKRTKRIVQISLCLAAIPLLLQGCSTAPEESTEEAAPVVVQGERLDAPIQKEPEPTVVAANAVIENVTGTTDIAEATPKKVAGSMPLNATGQKAVDALVGTVAPPSSTAALVKKSAASATAEIGKATADEKGYRRILRCALRV